jgi:hypothetical protein
MSFKDIEKPEQEFVETAQDEFPLASGRARISFTEEEEKALTKSLLRKLDTRMLPMLALLFLFSFLDR